MRVLHVLPSIAPSYGGPSTALIGLSRALSERDVYSEIVTTDLGYEDQCPPTHEYGQLVESNGVSVRYFPRCFPSFLPRDFALSPRLGHWLKEHILDYDIINIHGLFSYPNTVAGRTALNNGVPYVVRPCGMLDPWCLQQSWGRKKAYLKLFDQKLLRHAAAISFTTQQEAKVACINADQRKSVVIPLGVNSTDAGALNSACFPFPSDKKLILFLSRLDQKKGLNLLLPSLVRLREVRNDFICVIAGSGDVNYEARIKAVAASKKLEDVVWFIGFVDGNVKSQLLKTAKCFVLPSYQENFGVSAVEAMAVGCPVVISDQVNIHEAVSQAKAGVVVRCNVDDLFKALNAVLSNESSSREMGLNGQKLARAKYSWDQISGKVISLYEDCIDRSPRRLNRQIG